MRGMRKGAKSFIKKNKNEEVSVNGKGASEKGLSEKNGCMRCEYLYSTVGSSGGTH